MNKPFFIIGLLLINAATFSQNVILDIHKNKLADFIKIEKDLKSEGVIDSADYISFDNVAQPLLFRRPEKQLPNLIVYYYYYKKDSTIADVLYEWDKMNSKDYNDTAVVSKQVIKAFIDKYKKLYNQISKMYGKSSKQGDLDTYSKTEKVERKDLWKTKDNTEIELYITLSSRYVKSGFLTITPTYRIRLYIKH